MYGPYMNFNSNRQNEQNQNKKGVRQIKGSVNTQSDDTDKMKQRKGFSSNNPGERRQVDRLNENHLIP